MYTGSGDNTKYPTLASLITNKFKNLLNNDGIELHNLNVLIGPNGSGKSNFISVLEFLKNCIVATSDESQMASQFDNAITILGGSKMLDKGASCPAEITFTYNFTETPEIPKGLSLNLDLYVSSKDSKITISQDFVSDFKYSQREPFIYYKFHDRRTGDGVVSVWSDEEERKSHYEKVENIPTNTLGLVVLPNLLEKSSNPPERTPIYKVRRQLIENIRRWHFYNANYMNLSMIRSSEPKIGPTDVYLSPSGHNLALVMENLIQQDINFEENINLAMKSILPNTRRLRPVRTGLMSLNLEWYFSGIAERFYLNEMSDGTVRMLCWAGILLSPNLPTLLVIDEPELGIHASWMPVLAEWIKKASRRTQVIVSTHSPDLLDSFTDEANNVICFSAKNSHHFFAASLRSDLLKSKFDEGWKLGDLYRVGDATVGGWPW